LRISGKLINRAANSEDILIIIITDDETWCFLYNPESKEQSSMWKLLVAMTEREGGGRLLLTRTALCALRLFLRVLTVNKEVLSSLREVILLLYPKM
jgi:hypothetical protein